MYNIKAINKRRCMGTIVRIVVGSVSIMNKWTSGS